MARTPTSPAKARLFELAQFVVEMQLAAQDGADIQIVHDAKFRVPGLGRRRQVDIYISVSVADREFRRMVEVQRRGRAVDQAFIDQVEGKMLQLRMDRATIVAEAGFTEDVLARLQQNPDIDAIRTTPATQDDLLAFKLAELPKTIGLDTDFGTEELLLGEVFRVRGVDGPLDALVGVAESTTLPPPGIIGMTVQRTDSGTLLVGTWYIQNSARAIPLTSKLTFEEGTVTSQRRLPAGKIPQIFLSAKLDPR